MKNRSFQHQYQKQVKKYIPFGFFCCFFFHDWFPLEFVFTYNISLVCRMWWEINIYTRVDKKKIKSSRKEYATRTCFKFDQWKTFCENYKPIRVWLWLVYKFTNNYCPLLLFSEFIQTRKSYPTTNDKIVILTKNYLSYQAKIVLVN